VKLHPAEQYARDVINGKTPSCHWIQRAARRYFDDKKNAKKKGIKFNREAAERALLFFSLIELSEGETAGQPIQLLPWELFIIWNLFGWYRAKHPRWQIKLPDGRTEDTSGTRRFRVAYFEIASKNGKTTLLGAIGNMLAFADFEMGAQVYSIATKRDQAKICWNLAKRMIEDSPYLREEGGVEVLANNLNQPNTGSKYEPLSSDYNSLDGLNIHGAICDEVHAWKDRILYDKVRQKTGTRRQPLIIQITTAGNDTLSFCFTQREYTCKVLDGVIDNDEWFGVIYTIDDGDDPFNETNWFKANPSLGHHKKISDMRTLAALAKDIPTEKNAFLQYQLNVWVRGETKWMDMEAWRLSAGPVPASALEAFLHGRTCYAGLDLAFTQDLAAVGYVFPPVDEAKDPRYYVLMRFFCPAEAILKRSRSDRVPYDVWADQGWIIPTPGDFIDHKFIFAKIQQDMKSFKVKEMAFDRYGAEWIQSALADIGLTMIEFGQGYLSMSPPMKDLQVLIGKSLLAHGDHPILTWNADNVIATMDAAGNIKPDKEKSREKIDGIITIIMGLSRAMIRTEQKRSIYSTRGIVTV
jgi:phage terminase large subunit-like protein